MRRSVRWLALAILVAAAAHAEEAGKVLLRYRFEKGQSIGFRYRVQQTIDQEILGRKQTMKQAIGIGFVLDVREVDAEGRGAVTFAYDWAQMKMNAPMMGVDYDSDHPPDDVPMAARGMAALVGQSLSMTMAPDGSVSDIQGVEAMLDKMIANLKMPEGPLRDQMEKQIRTQFGPDAIKQMMSQLAGGLPEQPVAIGESWAKQVDISKGFPMLVDNTWTLQARKGGVATIGIESAIKPHPQGARIEMGPMKLSYSLQGKQKGSMDVEEATGWPLSMKLTQDISGTMTMEGVPGQPQPMTIPMSLASEATLQRHEKAKAPAP